MFAVALLAVVPAVSTVGMQPAAATCPAAGCLVDIQKISQTFNDKYGSPAVKATTWIRVDYTNHKARPYVTLEGLNGKMIYATGAYNNVSGFNFVRLGSGGNTVLEGSMAYSNSAGSPAVTFYPSGLYVCPTSPSNYQAVTYSRVYVANGNANWADVNSTSGTASTTCGW
jgi:hypothetical protein